MVESTMCLHIKVAELNPLSDGKGIHQSHFAARPRPQLIRGVNKPRPDKQT